MTPKEKAVQLVLEIGLLSYDDGINTLNKELTKECALICVNEIINTDMLIDNDTYDDTKSHLVYWQQVKTEITNL